MSQQMAWQLVVVFVSVLLGAVATRLWDALRFEARFISRDEVKALFADFDAVKIQPLRDRINHVDGRLDSIWQVLEQIKISMAEIVLELKHEKEKK